MAIASLSPNSILASPAHVNPQVRTDLQASVPQVAQDAQKSAKAAQTDTITISSQALKMADDKNALSKETAKKSDEQRALQLAGNKADDSKNIAQKNAEKAYATLSQ